MASSKIKATAKGSPKLTVKKTKMTVKKHSIVRSEQKKISNDFFSEANPSEITETFWIYATRKNGKYPKDTDKSGKWLIFVSLKNLDLVWSKIKIATEIGLLGDSSKAATAKNSPIAAKKDLKVICVYTYDFTDKKDVMRIREELRKIGVVNKIPYKTDQATRDAKYEVNGNTRISVYYE